MRLFTLFLFFVLSLTPPASAGDPVVDFAPDDPEMGMAIAKARGSLDQFLANGFDATGRGLDDSSLKVAFPVSGFDVSHEHIWVAALVRNGDAFTGQLANDPNFMPGFAYGSTVEFDRSMISDWSVYAADGKLHGHFTTRVVVTRMPQAEAAQYKALLAANPIPSGW